MSFSRPLALLSAFACASVVVSAQSTTDVAVDQGIKSYQAYHMSGIDSVNLQNGNLTVRIPVLSYPQRGSQAFSYSLVYNAKQLKPYSHCSGDICTDTFEIKAGTDIGFQLKADQGVSDDLNYIKQQYTECVTGSDPCHTSHFVFESQTLVDGTGASHALALTSTNHWRTADGSGYRKDIIDAQGDAQIVYPDGSVSGIDPNGNMISNGQEDTMGRSIFPGGYLPSQIRANTADIPACPSNLPLTTTKALTFTVPSMSPGGNGSSGTAQYTECFATVNVTGYYDITDGTSTSSDMTVLQGLVLPDESFWAFTYEAGTGNLTNIQLPLGGSIAYQWQQFQQPPCSQIPAYNGNVVSRTVTPNDGSGSHTWNYSWSPDWVATVTDPVGNDTTTQFVTLGTGSCVLYPQTVTSYKGAAASGLATKTVTTQYSGPVGSPSYMGVIGVYPTSVTTTVNGVTSQTQTDYNYSFTATDEETVYSIGNYTVPYGKAVTRREYDFGGSGNPGALIRTTATQYLAFNNSDYMNANMLNLVSSTTITDGVGNPGPQVQYNYDETSVLTSTVATQHTTAPWGSIRGNLTSTHTLLTGSTPVTTPLCNPNFVGGYLVSTKTYFDTGEVQATTDSCGQSTTYAYDPVTYAGAYPTSITNAKNQSSSKTYDFNTGLPITETDPNNQVTTYAYADPLARITDVTSPETFGSTSGHSHIDYPPTTAPNTLKVTEQISDSLTAQTLITVDGMGKLLSTALLNDPDGPTYVTHGYDALARESLSGNPTRCAPGNSCTESTAGATQHLFDEIGRENLTIPADGTSSTNNVVTSYSGSEIASMDQAHVATGRTYDALGRLISVTENPGWHTNYYYDILGDLTCVEQQGSVSSTGCSSTPFSDYTSTWRVRRFTYDSLGRLLSAKNPESGQPPTTYTYDANGNVITRQDARGYTTTYSYDELGRLTGKTYSNGDPTVAYTYDANSSTNFGVGRRTGMTDASGSTTWTYDNAGRVSSETRTIGTATHTTGTSYYLNGSPYQITYPSGNIVTYAAANGGRTTGVSDATNTYASSLHYYPAGELNTGTLGANEVTLSDQYNSRLQPTMITATSPVTGSLMSLSYSFGLGVNNNGNLYHLVNNNNAARNMTYAYDNANRLHQAHGDQDVPATSATATVQVTGFISPKCAQLHNCDSGTVSVTVGGTTESTTYAVGDSSGTILGRLVAAFTGDTSSVVTASSTGLTLTLTAQQPGASMNSTAISASVISDVLPTPAFTVTPSGSTLSGGTDATLAPGQLNETYTIDPWGNMTPSGTYPSPLAPAPAPDLNNRLTGYTYDGAGNLLSDGSTGNCSGYEYGWNTENQLACFGTYTYTYDGDGNRVAKSAGTGTLYWGSLAESDLSGNITSEYIFLNGKRIARRDIATGIVHYYIQDNLGSTSMVHSVSGGVENDSDFWPYGIEQAVTQNLPDQHFKFTGKERDAESGLDDFGARYFASSLGRWISPDWSARPTAVPYSNPNNPQTLNLFAYAGNNPVSLADADGHDTDTVPGLNAKASCNGHGTCDAGSGGGSNLDPDADMWKTAQESISEMPGAQQETAQQQASTGNNPSQGAIHDPACQNGGCVLAQVGNPPSGPYGRDVWYNVWTMNSDGTLGRIDPYSQYELVETPIYGVKQNDPGICGQHNCTGPGSGIKDSQGTVGPSFAVSRDWYVDGYHARVFDAGTGKTADHEELRVQRDAPITVTYIGEPK